MFAPKSFKMLNFGCFFVFTVFLILEYTRKSDSEIQITKKTTSIMLWFYLLIALLPVAVCLWFIYKKDKYQPEPISKLLIAFGLGILSAPLSFLISVPLTGIGLVPAYVQSVSDSFCDAFFGAAIPEETMKLAMLWVALRWNKYFDERVDGIVYAVFVGLGFAAIENVGYMFQSGNGWAFVGLMRGLMSIPGHMIFAMIMGYFYSKAHFNEEGGEFKYYALALGAPILAHGLYDMILMSLDVVNPGWVTGLFALLVYGMIKTYKWSVARLNEELAKDKEEWGFAEPSEKDSIFGNSYGMNYVDDDNEEGNNNEPYNGPMPPPFPGSSPTPPPFNE